VRGRDADRDPLEGAARAVDHGQCDRAGSPPRRTCSWMASRRSSSSAWRR
jgi:hypothetical protein